jgi:tRNA(adenine34) deaminase
MRRALDLAREAGKLGEVPVGALVVSPTGELLGVGRNTCIGSSDPAGHAEIVALRHAGARAGNYRLPGASLYVTIEPCGMCLGAMVHARIETLVFGCREPKAGAAVSFDLQAVHTGLNHRVRIEEGVLEEESRELMQSFFAARRRT